MFQSPSSLLSQEGLTRVILRAAVEPEGWGEVTARLSEAVDSPCSLVHARPGGTPVVHASGYDPDAMASYGAHYHRTNPYPRLWGGVPEGVVVTASAIVDEGELKRTEFYNDWARHQDDLVGGAGVILASRRAGAYFLACDIRARRREADEARAATVLRRLLPVLKGAIDVSRALAVREIDLAGARAGAAPGAALFAVAAGGTLLGANAAGAAMLAEPGGAVREGAGGRLSLADARAGAALCAAFHPASGPRYAGARLSAAFGGRGVHVVALDPEAAARLSVGWFGERDLPAALLVVEPAAPATAPAERLAAGLGLTAAEAGVALALADGRSPGEIAEARDVSVHTVRNQLKSAMGKAGVRRQAEFARRVADLLR